MNTELERKRDKELQLRQDIENKTKINRELKNRIDEISNSKSVPVTVRFQKELIKLEKETLEISQRIQKLRELKEEKLKTVNINQFKLEQKKMQHKEILTQITEKNEQLQNLANSKNKIIEKKEKYYGSLKESLKQELLEKQVKLKTCQTLLQEEQLAKDEIERKIRNFNKSKKNDTTASRYEEEISEIEKKVKLKQQETDQIIDDHLKQVNEQIRIMSIEKEKETRTICEKLIEDNEKQMEKQRQRKYLHPREKPQEPEWLTIPEFEELRKILKMDLENKILFESQLQKNFDLEFESFWEFYQTLETKLKQLDAIDYKFMTHLDSVKEKFSHCYNLLDFEMYSLLMPNNGSPRPSTNPLFASFQKAFLSLYIIVLKENLVEKEANFVNLDINNIKQK